MMHVSVFCTHGVRLLGLCREAEPHYMVLEYVDLVGSRGHPGGWGGGSAGACVATPP